MSRIYHSTRNIPLNISNHQMNILNHRGNIRYLESWKSELWILHWN